MGPNNFEEYLKLLAAMLRTSRTRKEDIVSELREHFEERFEELRQDGKDNGEATSIVLDEFGDAAALAAQFLRVIRKQRRRLVMRSTVGVIGAMLVALFLASAYWPSGSSSVSSVAAAGNAGVAAAITPYADQDALVREKLAKPISVKLSSVSLVNSLQMVAKQAGIPIHAKWRHLEEEGIDEETAVSVELKDVPGEMVLDLILDQISDDVSFAIQKGVVIVSSKANLDESNLVVQVYDLDQCLPSKDEDADAIDIDGLIRETIAPKSWDYGPTMATWNHLLVVTQTPAVHQKIGELLSKLGTVKKK